MFEIDTSADEYQGFNFSIEFLIFQLNFSAKYLTFLNRSKWN